MKKYKKILFLLIFLSIYGSFFIFGIQKISLEKYKKSDYTKENSWITRKNYAKEIITQLLPKKII